LAIFGTEALIRTEDAQPKLGNAERAKPGKKVRWFGSGADSLQTEWSANAYHPYCFV